MSCTISTLVIPDSARMRKFLRYFQQSVKQIHYIIMWLQKEIKLKKKNRGFHLVTDEILGQLPELAIINVGLLNIFIQHTSASLTINENADPTVRADFESYFNRSVPENEPYYKHTLEGSDDLPAHLKFSILGSNLTIPIISGHLGLGTWQGVYLCEHRNSAGARRLIVSIHGEEYGSLN